MKPARVRGLWRTLAVASLVFAGLSARAAAPQLYSGDFPGHVGGYSSRSVDVIAGREYRYQISATGATSFAVDGLPAGLSVDGASGLISGTLPSAGSYPLTLKALNADGTTSAAVTLTVSPVPTEVPVISPIGDMDQEYMPVAFADTSLGYHRFTLSATNAPYAVSVSGLPGGVTYDAIYREITYNLATIGPGRHTCTVTATNEAGSSVMTFHWDVHPTIVDRGIRCDKPVYYSGDRMTFTVTCNSVVYVTGTPYIALDYEATRRALYVSGSGTDTLTFTYQTSLADGDLPTTALFEVKADGATIQSQDGMSCTLWAHSQRYIPQPSFRLDAPHLDFTTGRGTVGTAFALYQNGAVGSATYRITNGVLPAGLSLEPASGAITGTPSAAGTAVVTVEAKNPNGLTVTKDVTVTIDAAGSTPTVAAILGVAGPEPGYRNTSFYLYVTYDRPVVVSGQPSLTVHIGSQSVEAKASPSTVASTKVAFWCYVQGSAIGSFDGPVSVDGAINLNGGSIRSDGQDAALTFTPPDLSGIVVDTIVPTAPTLQVDSDSSATPAFSGNAEPYSTVSVAAAGTPAVTAVADANGAWRALWTAAALSRGTYRFNANARDRALNVSSASPYVSVTVASAPADTPPPANTPPPDNPPPTPGKADQAITFSSPVSAIMVGQPIQLGATSSAGLPITYTVVSGDATLSGTTLTPTSTATLIVRASSAGDATTNAASVDVNFGNPQKAAQAITVSTPTGSVAAEKPVALAATTTSGLPVSYSVVSGPATITGSRLVFTGTGTVTVKATQAGNGGYAPANDVTLTFNAVPVNRLINLSSRVHVSAGDATHGAIAGFVVTGEVRKPVLIRAVGPSLTSFGVAAPLAAPQLRIYDRNSVLLATNTGWADDAQIRAAGDSLGAFSLGRGSRDAAVLLTLEPGSYTAQVQSGDSGTALIEVYDGSAMAAVPTRQLVNISTRATVGSGQDIVVAGFVVAGTAPKRVLIRAAGPALAAFGVDGASADPKLQLQNPTGAVLARNDDWETAETGDPIPVTPAASEVAAAASKAGAFAFPSGGKDAAMLVTLEPGTYTATVSSADGRSGVVLVEVYDVP